MFYIRTYKRGEKMLSNITYWLDETTDRFPDKIGYVDGNGDRKSVV